ncbi:MAG TPA: ferritin family protein [Sedimentisphaerales bacterium]|nr:ferritin family protein [Sedimentisphaerales bacterium]
MDIFEFAMKKERLSEEYYRQLAGKTSQKGLQSIFSMLADEEAHHYQVVEQMRSKTPDKVASTDVLAEAKEVFARMSEGTRKFDFDAGEVQIYKKARDIEEESWKFYLQKADEVEDPGQKGIFRKLADEEKKHYFLLENIIDFVSRPETWLENAEFYHLEEY